MAALLSPSSLPGKLMGCNCNRQGALPQIRVETLIGSQAKFEITKLNNDTSFHQIMYYKNCSKFNFY